MTHSCFCLAGMDKKGVNYFVFYGANFATAPKHVRSQLEEAIEVMVNFISSRNYRWSIIYVHGGSTQPITWLKTEFAKIKEDD